MYQDQNKNPFIFKLFQTYVVIWRRKENNMFCGINFTNDVSAFKLLFLSFLSSILLYFIVFLWYRFLQEKKKIFPTEIKVSYSKDNIIQLIHRLSKSSDENSFIHNFLFAMNWNRFMPLLIFCFEQQNLNESLKTTLFNRYTFQIQLHFFSVHDYRNI